MITIPDEARAVEATLLPCPFCASKCRLQFGMSAFADAVVECTGCEIQGPTFDSDELDSPIINAKAAAMHWNTRAPGQQMKPGGDPDYCERCNTSHASIDCPDARHQQSKPSGEKPCHDAKP